VGLLWVACAFVSVWVARNNNFAGKPAFILAFSGMLWWFFTVVVDLNSHGLPCKMFWSLAAWPGIVLLPMAWAFFLFDYTMNTNQARKPFRLMLYIIVPTIVSIVAITNGQTHLIYGADTQLVSTGGKAFVVYDHGPFFYVVAAFLYLFVMSALSVLIYAFFKAKKSVRPFLGVLFIITATPLVANVAYVGWGVALFGLDPTPFMFALALMAFSWLILNNSMMDTEAQGRNLMFYATQDPVIIMDAGGKFAGANSAAKRLFGAQMPKNGGTVDHLEIIGPRLHEFRETGVLNCAEPIRLGGRAFDLRTLPIESPIQTKNNLLGWSVSLMDITERERSTEVLREAVAHAEAANHAKSQFLAMISHELRTPMTSVKGGLDLALHGALGDVSDPLKNVLTIAQRNSLRLLKLIDDVLDLQKIDLKEINLKLQDLNSKEFLHDIVEEYEAYASKEDVQLDIISDGKSWQLRADIHRLKQVVGNVISNAVKFSPEGGHVECSTHVVGANLRFSIKDSGIGIPQGNEDQVFGRFNQVPSSSSKASGGSGLGMNIAKLLIEHMDGSISYESQFGTGSTFYIDIPLSPQDDLVQTT
jgi:signal transduction histidine kinase